MSLNPNLYPKPALSCQDQVKLLLQRGLIITDVAAAEQTLQQTSYYRLRGYYIQWYDKTLEKFTSQKTFNDIIRLHEFDSMLSSLMLDVLTIIEVNLRTYIAHDMAFCSDWSATPHLDLGNYKSPLVGSDMIGMIYRAIWDSKDREVFIKHHLDNYNDVVPIWAIVEILSLGQLSRLFSNLSANIKSVISYTRYGQSNFEYVGNWLHVAYNYRNVCAHQSRLYHRLFTASKVKVLSSDPVTNKDRSTLYAGLLAIKYLSCNNRFCFNWFTRLETLITDYSDVVDVALMGFPPDWKGHLK